MLTAEQRQQLDDARRAILSIHKALLEEERVRHERAHGRVESSLEFLQLALHDPWFAWLHPLSELVVQIDELVASKEPPDPSAAAALVNQAKELLRPDELGNPFQRRYHHALQDVPAVVLAHAAARKLLGIAPAPRIP
jgi:hypothetical protein